MENKDEYIYSLLLSLFLMQGEIDRLNQTLDLARKGELVYIKNPQIAELKAENTRLIEGLGLANKYVNKYHQTLQEIKSIAEPFAKCYTHTCRNCEKYDSSHACCLKDINCYKYNDGSKSSCKDFVLPTKQFYQQILANVMTKITKAESEEV